MLPFGFAHENDNGPKSSTIDDNTVEVGSSGAATQQAHGAESTMILEDPPEEGFSHETASHGIYDANKVLAILKTSPNDVFAAALLAGVKTGVDGFEEVTRDALKAESFFVLDSLIGNADSNKEFELAWELLHKMARDYCNDLDELRPLLTKLWEAHVPYTEDPNAVSVNRAPTLWWGATIFLKSHRQYVSAAFDPIIAEMDEILDRYPRIDADQTKNFHTKQKRWFQYDDDDRPFLHVKKNGDRCQVQTPDGQRKDCSNTTHCETIYSKEGTSNLALSNFGVQDTPIQSHIPIENEKGERKNMYGMVVPSYGDKNKYVYARCTCPACAIDWQSRAKELYDRHADETMNEDDYEYVRLKELTIQYMRMNVELTELLNEVAKTRTGDIATEIHKRMQPYIIKWHRRADVKVPPTITQ
jgi:hypothetical protein